MRSALHLSRQSSDSREHISEQGRSKVSLVGCSKSVHEVRSDWYRIFHTYFPFKPQGCLISPMTGLDDFSVLLSHKLVLHVGFDTKTLVKPPTFLCSSGCSSSLLFLHVSGDVKYKVFISFSSELEFGDTYRNTLDTRSNFWYQTLRQRKQFFLNSVLIAKRINGFKTCFI